MELAIEMSCETRPDVSKGKERAIFWTARLTNFDNKAVDIMEMTLTMSKWPIDCIDKWVIKTGNVEARKMG
jgi:hypothetical protein